MNAVLKQDATTLAALAAPEAEAAVIGALLTAPGRWGTAAGITDADFTEPAHKAVFVALEALHEHGAVADAPTVIQWLRDHADAGGDVPDAATVTALINAAANDDTLLQQRVQTVRAKAAQRRAAAALARLAEAAARPDADVPAIAARLDALTRAIRETSAGPDAALREGVATPLALAALHAVPAQHPHWMRGEHGRALYPVGEVSVVGGPGRAGKTLGTLGLILSALDGQPIGDLQPPTEGRVVIYSAEDGVEDYLRMLRAQQIARGWDDTHLARVLDRLRIPELHGEHGRALRTLLTQGPDRLPLPTEAAGWIIQSCRQQGVTLIVFETLSKLSEVDETNIAFKRFIAVLERVAEALECAVVLVHHVSQASLPNLKNLDLDTSAFRGGTALPDDARQTAMMVNLGSRNEPAGDTDDCRTRLREMAFPGAALTDEERLTVYVTLDSSKSSRPRPIFLKWLQTNYGPAPVVAVPTVGDCAQVPWERLLEAVRPKKHTSSKDGTQKGGATNGGWTVVRGK